MVGEAFMYEWQKQIQRIVDIIDEAIQQRRDHALTLYSLSKELGYSKYHMTRKFKEITGVQLKEYVRLRKMAFALKEVRDRQESILDIAITYGYTTHEAFTRAFKQLYGMTPSAYRSHPKPVILRTKIHPFDRYFLGMDELGNEMSSNQIYTYIVKIPAHKFLYIENKESNGYWDFWEKQSHIAGQDHDSICGLLDSIKGKLDDYGGNEANCGAGQIMAYKNDPNGRLCDWGYLRTECWGARLPIDHQMELPSNFQLLDVPEAEYIVFEHGPFDYEQENRSVEAQLEQAMKLFDYESIGYELDDTANRLMYFYYNPEQYFKYIRPICKAKKEKIDEEMV